MNQKDRPNRQQLATALDLAHAAHAAIVTAGPDGIPSGHLYATLMSHLSLQTYESMLTLLVRARLIERRANHRLVAV